jgi:hypothetical protein
VTEEEVETTEGEVDLLAALLELAGCVKTRRKRFLDKRC